MERISREWGRLSDFVSVEAAIIFFSFTCFSLHWGQKMSELAISETMLKRAMKEALVEVLEERREYVRDIIEEVLEEFELIEDIREVKKADRVRRSVFSVREGEA